MKREFLQLLHKYDSKKHFLNSWFMSEKLDGRRVFWDGGISRGIPTDQVPYANTVKDKRFVDEKFATGLWSRYGKAIQAPDTFLDKLPKIFLDGELFLGLGLQQELMSITSSHEGTDWSDVKFMILDSPPLETIFKDGVYDVRMANTLYKIKLDGCYQWVRQLNKHFITVGPDSSFEQVLGFLRSRITENDNVRIHKQVRLSYNSNVISETIEAELAKVVELGGEGLVFRNPISVWRPERSHNALKYKPYTDDEAIVTGYTWGVQTDFGSKLLGLMGNMIVNYKGKRLELSGFKESERELSYKVDSSSAFAEGVRCQGEIVGEDIENHMFPRGSVVTIKFRELTRDGVPKECTYLRRQIL